MKELECCTNESDVVAMGSKNNTDDLKIPIDADGKSSVGHSIRVSNIILARKVACVGSRSCELFLWDYGR
jgi:hypothetical protein